MSAPDDLQKLWRDGAAREDDAAVWSVVIRERRSSRDELVRTEDRAWYLVALCLGLLTAWAAWKAKYPWVQAGYGLMAATVALSAAVTWIASRRDRIPHDRSLREHLEALRDDYNRRIRFVRRGGWSSMVALCVGLAAVVLGFPGNAGNPLAWAIAGVLVAGAMAGQFLHCRHMTARISLKRDDADRLLKILLAGGKAAR